MGERYEPGIGQMGFGNPHGESWCPEWMVALIKQLAWHVGIFEHGRRSCGDSVFHCPTGNTGSLWSNDTFSLRAYGRGGCKCEACRAEGDVPHSPDCPVANPNFKCGDIEVRWHESIGRRTTINRAVTAAEAIEMFDRCRESLDRRRAADAAASGLS